MRGKLGNFCYYKTQKLGKNPNFGVKPEIQRARFGYLSPKFLEANFGAKPLRPPNMEVPPLGFS